MTAPPDEFAWIERLKPLTRGDPRALGLNDDAAVLPCRAGHDLVVSKDAMVEGVHFLAGEACDLVARRLIRTNLSDLAAKAAEPFGYFLVTAWPAERTWGDREAFIAGLAADGEAFDISLLGGDTVSTPGPLVVGATVLGWCPSGAAVLRSGARAGDLMMALGVIGDGWLGLKAARGEISDPGGRLASHYRAPRPLVGLRDLLRLYARAAADVSDGLVADAGHIARASGLGLTLDLDGAPLSISGEAWCAAHADPVASRVDLATGGDDYAIVCAVDPAHAAALRRGAAALGVPAAQVGVLDSQAGIRIRCGGRTVTPEKSGWTH